MHNAAATPQRLGFRPVILAQRTVPQTTQTETARYAENAAIMMRRIIAPPWLGLTSRALLCPSRLETEQLIRLQSRGHLMGDKNHGRLTFEAVHRGRETFRGKLVQT